MATISFFTSIYNLTCNQLKAEKLFIHSLNCESSDAVTVYVASINKSRTWR